MLTFACHGWPVERISKGETHRLLALSTAEIKDERFADQAFHIASPFRMAGFGYITGSLRSEAIQGSLTK
jgi:hypothetical protein